MKFPILATVILFCIVLSYYIRKSNKESEHALDEFWEKEKKANFTRKKPLDDLNYISIPEEISSMQVSSAEGKDALITLNQLSTQKICNFTGITNTDLKLTYGTANITVLSEYDQNYTMMVRALQKLAVELEKEGQISSVETVLSFAVEAGTDISASYELLAKIYKNTGKQTAFDSLLEKAKELNTLTSASIVRKLEEMNE